MNFGRIDLTRTVQAPVSITAPGQAPQSSYPGAQPTGAYPGASSAYRPQAYPGALPSSTSSYPGAAFVFCCYISITG